MVHAGWRGILGGVIESAMDLLSDVTVGPFRAVIGPCINACCYAFGVDDLERIVAHLGDGAGGKTRTGHPALDLPAAVIATLRGWASLNLSLMVRAPLVTTTTGRIAPPEPGSAMPWRLGWNRRKR